MTYGELDRKARAIGAFLQQAAERGSRALLIYPSELEFIAAFFGCLYGGLIAVPTYPPQTRTKRSLAKLRAIMNDVQPAVVLTTAGLASMVASVFALAPDLPVPPLICTDEIGLPLADTWQDPGVDSKTLAFLQYTSGSTGMPKGVMLTHGNLLYNAQLIYRHFDLSSESRGLSWLPLYHDMGLIGMTLQAAYAGVETTIMSPVAFLQRPIRWLQAISNTRANTSGGPNFAYDLCARKITAEQKTTLDLSSWKIAFNGAEPIRRETLERFAEAFAPCGFNPEIFRPCYGLAEATLLVAGVQDWRKPSLRTVQKAALEQNQVVLISDERMATDGQLRERPVGTGGETERSGGLVPVLPEDVRTFVSSGISPAEQKIVIADPEACTLCSPSQVGEIWVAGPSIAQGYWQKPEETKHTFQAYLSKTRIAPSIHRDASTEDSGQTIRDGTYPSDQRRDAASPADSGQTIREGPFLRTGDLGFVHNGELFVTGRLKDLIIIRGRNHYPQDIELTVERSHPALRSGCGVAFSVDVLGGERLVIVYEVDRQYRAGALPAPQAGSPAPTSRDVGASRAEGGVEGPRGRPAFDVEEVAETIRKAVAEQHELQVYAVVLIKTGSIPKTSSGKLQRNACKQGYLAQSLEVVEQWTLSVDAGSVVERGRSLAPALDAGAALTINDLDEQWTSDEVVPTGNGSHMREGSPPVQIRNALLQAEPAERQEMLEDYLLERIATSLSLSRSRLDRQQPLNSLGLDSLSAVELKNWIEAELQVEVPITIFLQEPTIAQFSAQLLVQLTTQAPMSEGAPGSPSVQEAVNAGADAIDGLSQHDAERLLAQLDQLSEEEVDTLLSQLAVGPVPVGDSIQFSDGPGNGEGSVPVQDAEHLLAELDQLSDEEVDALLSQLASEEEMDGHNGASVSFSDTHLHSRMLEKEVNE